MDKPFVVKVSELNDERTDALVHAMRHHPSILGGNVRKYDSMVAKAERNYYEGLARLGVRLRRRAVRLATG